MQASKARGEFWDGVAAGGLLAVGLNLLPYLRTRDAYQTDGLEVIGFPFVFRRFGGIAGHLDFHWWALIADLLLAALLAVVLGAAWALIRSRRPLEW